MPIPRLSASEQRRLRLVHLLRAISVELDLDRAAFARANGLRDTDVRALIELLDARRAGISATPGWLSRRLGLTSASTTGLIDRLEAAGHVRRERSGHDRRKVELFVTDEMVGLGWDFFGPLLAAMVDAMDAEAPNELDVVERVLARIVSAVQRTGQSLAGGASDATG